MIGRAHTAGSRELIGLVVVPRLVRYRVRRRVDMWAFWKSPGSIGRARGSRPVGLSRPPRSRARRPELSANPVERGLEVLETCRHVAGRDPGIRVESVCQQPQILGASRILDLLPDTSQHLGVPCAEPREPFAPQGQFGS